MNAADGGSSFEVVAEGVIYKFGDYGLEKCLKNELFVWRVNVSCNVIHGIASSFNVYVWEEEAFRENRICTKLDFLREKVFRK